MASPNPKSPYLKAGTYDQEIDTFGDANNLLRFFATKALRVSLTSPPLAHDIEEGTSVLDKTLLRIYFKVDNVLRYIQLT